MVESRVGWKREWGGELSVVERERESMWREIWVGNSLRKMLVNGKVECGDERGGWVEGVGWSRRE